MDRIGIVGAGAFGTGLAQALATSGRDVMLWSSTDAVVEAIRDRRESPRLPDVVIHEGVVATKDPEALCRACRFIVVAVASVDAVDRANTLGAFVHGNHLLVHAIGGLVPEGNRTVIQVLQEHTAALRVGVLAGPALPGDLVGGRFSSMVCASKFDEVSAEARRLLSVPPRLRVYQSTDAVGVELASALAGAYTVVLGLADSLKVGSGARAVLVTRAVAEASRLGETLGADARTFAGLAGLGNLLVRSNPAEPFADRDYRLGWALGAGDDSGVDSPEGPRAVRQALRIAESKGVRMPVLEALLAVLDGSASAGQVAAALADTVATTE